MKICDEIFVLGEEERLYRRQLINPKPGISKISEFYDSDGHIMFRHVFYENETSEGTDDKEKRLFFMKWMNNTAVYYDWNDEIIFEVEMEKNCYTVRKFISGTIDKEITTSCNMENSELIFHDENMDNFHVKLWYLSIDDTGKTVRMISGETREEIEYSEGAILKKRIYHHDIYQYSVRYDWKKLLH